MHYEYDLRKSVNATIFYFRRTALFAECTLTDYRVQFESRVKNYKGIPKKDSTSSPDILDAESNQRKPQCNRDVPMP
jgi:hypothetical protein